MNYFPFHLGDYAAHTAHLEPMEDLAYRRLLDLYYMKEGPLPADIQVTAKLVRMRSMECDVATVLNEFFTLTDAGWTHNRCEIEISRMQNKQIAYEERDQHEKTRMQKHRERRAEMFAQIAEIGVFPPWNVKTGDLEWLVSQHLPEPVTAPVTQPVTLITPLLTNEVTPVTPPVTPPVTTCSSQRLRPATAIPIPIPIPIPILSKEGEEIDGSEDFFSSAKLPPCPHETLIEIFAKQLPNLPQPRKSLWPKSVGAAALRARWQWVLTEKHEKGELTGQRMATTKIEGIAWFDRFFCHVAKSEFLSGRNEKFLACDLAWLLKTQNFAKVLAGNYDK